MEFKEPYLRAMREQAPKMFNELRRTGAMDAHLQAKSAEAHRMLRDLTTGMETLPNGLVRDANVLRMAEEQVRATLIEFPNERPMPTDVDGEMIPMAQPLR